MVEIDRPKYVMNEAEKKIVIGSLLSIGPDEYYYAVKNNALLSMDRIGDSDEVLLDMSEAMLEDARNEKEDDVIKACYSASIVLRKVAHEINRILISKGKEPGGRFLYLASNNKEAPLL